MGTDGGGAMACAAGGRPESVAAEAEWPATVDGACCIVPIIAVVVVVIGRGGPAAPLLLPWNTIGVRCGTSSFTVATSPMAAVVVVLAVAGAAVGAEAGAGKDGDGTGGIIACKGNHGDVVVEDTDGGGGGGKSTTQPSARHRRYK